MDDFDISKALEALSNGEVIVYPTDTLYGLGADIFNLNAVKNVYRIKKRPMNQPLSVSVSNIDQLCKIAYKNKLFDVISEKFLPGKLTVILNKRDTVPDIVTAGKNKIAIRIPNNNIALRLLSEFGPITSTSANIHGKKTPDIISDILMQFKADISVYIDIGKLFDLPSTIVDLTDNNIKIVRLGSISKKEIMDAIENG